MKKVKILSLFFILLYHNESFVGQQRTDSLSFYSALVSSPKTEKDLINSYHFFNRHSKISLAKNDTISTIYALWHKASIEYKNGFLYDSEETMIKALALSEKIKSSPYLKKLKKGIFNHLGIMYREQEDLHKSINLYNKALHFSKNKKDSAIIYNNMGIAYKNSHQLKKSKKYFSRALQIIKDSKDTLSTALILDNLGFVKSKMKIEGALKDLNEALQFRIEKNDISSIYISYKHIAQFYKERQQVEKAKKYALQAYQIALKLNSVTYKQNALGLLLELSNDTYAKQYKTINDSITLAKQKQNNKFALMKYDLTKQEKLTTESKLRTEKEKSKRLISQFIGVLLFISIIFLFYFLKSKHKKNLVENILKTEEHISKKVHDVVANDLYLTMTKLQAKTNSKEDILDDLESVYNKARNISRSNSFIDDKGNFNETLNDLFMNYRNPKTLVITKDLKKINWKKISIHEKNMLYRVLQELMTNMKKYSKSSMVTLSFEQRKKNIHITYKDNGIGCNLIKNNGLLNAENRIKSIQGKITFESKPTKGFKVKITI